ncbi:hypothetical protein STEG23_004779 [Scotinomys teguina]
MMLRVRIPALTCTATTIYQAVSPVLLGPNTFQTTFYFIILGEGGHCILLEEFLRKVWQENVQHLWTQNARANPTSLIFTSPVTTVNAAFLCEGEMKLPVCQFNEEDMTEALYLTNGSHSKGAHLGCLLFSTVNNNKEERKDPIDHLRTLQVVLFKYG